jgi:predicted dehydrogenase
MNLDTPKITRRKLAAAVAAPMILSSRVMGANDRIRVGVIGVGGRSKLLIDQLPETAEIVAAADCYPVRATEAAAKRQAKWTIYNDHRRLLEQKDIDGVIVGTADHQRVFCCVHACQAGKDVYAEKPLTLHVSEGRTLVQAARRYNRVFQVGSQQRSMAMNRLAADFVKKGGIGKVHTVYGVNYSGPRVYEGLPEEPVPAGLNWDLWQSQTEALPYNRKLQFGWMGWSRYSGGEMTNWGAHGIDQIQFVLGQDLTGPVEFWPIADGQPGAVAFRYANGVVAQLVMPSAELSGGAMFVGTKARIEVVRNNFRTDPPRLVKDLPPPEEVQKWRDDVALWQARYHLQNWLECMKTREKPAADVEIGHRSVSVCHLVGITRKLNRKLTWDPDKETFPGDAEASALLSRPRRRGYELPDLA